MRALSSQFFLLLYREAVLSQSPGLPLRLPWVTGLDLDATATRLGPPAQLAPGCFMIVPLPRVEATLGFET